MRTVILGERPAELEALIESRRRTGADLYDEVWEGEYHMAPAPHGRHGALDGELAALLHPHAKRLGLANSGPFNLGEADDFRVPDRGLRDPAGLIWYPTAPLVVEIVSPDDETWAKLPFYAAHRVGELVVVDPASQRVTWLRLDCHRYAETASSELLGIDVAGAVAQVDWPPADV